MRRLIAVAASAVFLAVPVTAAHAYDRQCGGVVDTECSGWVCPTDCWQRDCWLWVDYGHNPMTAQCIRQVVPSS
jgi:hypothetical protein